MADTASDQQVTQAIKIGVAATLKGDHATALKVFKAVYDNPAIKAPPDGLSYFGLSLAVGENQTGRGVQLCKDAISTQFFDERHHENLVRIHLHKGNRTSAVSALEEGLRNVPTGSRLLALQKEMGIATAPVKTVSAPGTRKLDLKSLPPVVTLLVGLLFFVAVFGVTFYVAYQQAYGP
jgi:hypothetical protein